MSAWGEGEGGGGSQFGSVFKVKFVFLYCLVWLPSYLLHFLPSPPLLSPSSCSFLPLPQSSIFAASFLSLHPAFLFLPSAVSVSAIIHSLSPSSFPFIFSFIFTPVLSSLSVPFYPMPPLLYSQISATLHARKKKSFTHSLSPSLTPSCISLPPPSVPNLLLTPLHTHITLHSLIHLSPPPIYVHPPRILVHPHTHTPYSTPPSPYVIRTPPLPTPTPTHTHTLFTSTHTHTPHTSTHTFSVSTSILDAT